MRPFADLSPMAWGLQGFIDVFARGGGLAAVWPESAALCALGAAAGAFAVLRLSREWAPG
jgi:ABC-2 type transport system permease protein